MSPTHVLIDSTNEAYTLFLSYPPNTTKEQIQAAEVELAARSETAKIMKFASFKELENKATLIKNEYPDIAVEKGLVQFLEKYPSTPIGITWNGGVAITRNDYVYAERRLKDYKLGIPELYDLEQPTDRASDPIHPLNHFEPLLGADWNH